MPLTQHARHPRNHEDRLDHDRAGDDVAEDLALQRGHGHQRVLQHVADDGGGSLKPLARAVRT